MNEFLQTEQEAALGLLIISVNKERTQLNDAQIQTILRMVVFSTRFDREQINAQFTTAYTAQLKSEPQDYILHCASLIQPEFAQTLFAMCCEAALSVGHWQESDSETLATIGIALGVSMDDLKMIIRTYLIRHKWSVSLSGV